MNRILFNVFILMCLLLLSPRGAAASTFPSTIEGLCRAIHSEVDKPSGPEKKFSFMTKLGMKLSPHKFIAVSSNGVVARPYTETIIFTMRPDRKDIPDSPTIKKREREIYLKSRKTQKNIRGLVKTKDEESCLKKAGSLQISNEELQAYREILRLSEENQELYLSNYFQTFSEEAAGHFKNSRVVGVSDTDQVLQYVSGLERKDYNFVFLFHADRSGRLYDYSRFIVESDFFIKIKNKVSSIAIFSCFPEEVSHYYSNALKKIKSSGIAVFRPVLKGEFQEANSTPIGLLEEFSRQVASIFQEAEKVPL